MLLVVSTVHYNTRERKSGTLSRNKMQMGEEKRKKQAYFHENLSLCFCDKVNEWDKCKDNKTEETNKRDWNSFSFVFLKDLMPVFISLAVFLFQSTSKPP